MYFKPKTVSASGLDVLAEKIIFGNGTRYILSIPDRGSNTRADIRKRVADSIYLEINQLCPEMQEFMAVCIAADMVLFHEDKL